MKSIACILLVLFSIFAQSFGSDAIAPTLIKEWSRFRAQVDRIEPQGDIGGHVLYRDYEDMTLLWRTSTGTNDNEVIRFFMQRSSGEIFCVTYHKSDVIVPGKIVLRRFVGTEPTGWINHTIDLNTSEYLGTQGIAPTLMPQEKKMMKKWGIHAF